MVNFVSLHFTHLKPSLHFISAKYFKQSKSALNLSVNSKILSLVKFSILSYKKIEIGHQTILKFFN